jgi:hypothetical protein
VEVIFAFDHQHQPGEICGRATCEHANKPTLAGTEVFHDISMLIVREASEQEYLEQPIPEGWCIPPLDYGCEYIYEVLCD